MLFTLKQFFKYGTKIKEIYQKLKKKINKISQGKTYNNNGDVTSDITNDINRKLVFRVNNWNNIPLRTTIQVKRGTSIYCAINIVVWTGLIVHKIASIFSGKIQMIFFTAEIHSSAKNWMFENNNIK